MNSKTTSRRGMIIQEVSREQDIEGLTHLLTGDTRRVHLEKGRADIELLSLGFQVTYWREEKLHSTKKVKTLHELMKQLDYIYWLDSLKEMP